MMNLTSTAVVLTLLIYPLTFTEYALIPGQYTDFALDQQGNIIMADAEGNISKKDANGRSLATQAYSNHGSYPQIDASNGLQVLVYFPSARHLLMLDNQLNQRRMVDFNSLENYQIRGFGLASDGYLWILDGRDGFLKKLDYQGRVLASTMLAGEWLPSGKTRIYDDGQYLFLGTENDQTIRVLNATLNRIRLFTKPPGYWDARDGSLFYVLDSRRLIREPLALESRKDTLTLEGAPLRRFRVAASLLVNQSDRGLHLYR